MNRRQRRTLLSLYAIDVFLDAHQDRLPTATSTGTRQRFARALAELELHVRTQAVSPIVAEGLTQAKDEKRQALLRDHLAPIARIARLEAANQPALAPLKMPRGEPGTGKLLSHATGMVSVARDHADVFIAAGLPPTFVEDLLSAIDEIRATLTSRTERRGALAGATRGLRTTLAACNRYKAVLHAFIEREAYGDARLLGHWRSVKRVGRLASRRRNLPSAAGTWDHSPTPSLAGPALPIRDPNRLLAPPKSSHAARGA